MIQSSVDSDCLLRNFDFYDASAVEVAIPVVRHKRAQLVRLITVDAREVRGLLADPLKRVS